MVIDFITIALDCQVTSSTNIDDAIEHKDHDVTLELCTIIMSI
jgi:hypothetical protein